ncbi:hypothetical protein AAGR22_19250 [Erwinia sp. HDF1-3R]|uniref:hypothetical protein n=1 Tax=Erwinia sp. HDF1-3R TaxID=3141543 RepID=UPI0031F48EBA
MKLRTVNTTELTRLTTGGKHRFSHSGITIHKKKPLREGLFFARFSANRQV